MQDHQSLQRQQHALSGLDKTSLTPSEQTLALELDLTAQNSKSELSKELVVEFRRKFARESPDAIQWVFQAWRDRSPYFPPISDIHGLFATWHQKRAEVVREENAARERKELEAARARGELVEFADLKQMCAKLVEKMGPLPEIEEMAKPFDDYKLPPQEELIRRRNEQMKAFLEKYGDRLKGQA